MYDDGGLSDVMATDMNSMLHSSTFKHPASNGEYSKMKDIIMSSDSYSNYNHHEHNQNLGRNQNHPQNHRQSESSLTRYRSAPSSFYAHLLEDDFLAPETSSNHAPFFSQQQQQQQYQLQQQQQQQLDSHEFNMYESSSMKLEREESGIQKIDFSPMSTSIYCENTQNNSVNNHPNNNNPVSSSTFRSMNSTSTNLIRQSSSPAGFLSTLNSENGFGGMRDVEKIISSSSLNNHISFSPGQSSSSMFIPQIPENKNQINDSTLKSFKRTRDGDSITLERLNGLSGHYTPGLIHHLSLPKTSTEMAVAEKYLRFGQDLVPSKSRAARGCATHPRSIAERVRRTRISERMKKLQDLFPNMDKQTSTADMLDMAVQYIKNLQKDLKNLKDARSRCACSSKQ